MARWVARVFGVGLVFLIALAVGLVIHVDLPAGQRVLVHRVNALLEPIFAGHLVIARVGSVGLSHVDFVDARVEGPGRELLIDASGVTARVSTPALLRSLFAGGDIVVDIPHVTVAGAHIVLDADEDANLRIAKAFAPRSPSGATPSGGGRGVRLTMPDVHVIHAAVRGQPPGLPPIDAQVDEAEASLSFEHDKLTLDVVRARWSGRGLPVLPEVQAQGDAVVRLSVPSDTGRAFGLHVVTHGAVGSIAVATDATYDGGDLVADVEVPMAKPDEVRSILPSWPLTVPLQVHVSARGSVASVVQLAMHAHASFGVATLDVAGPVTLAPRIEGSLHVDAKRIDLSAFSPSFPSSDLSATGDLSIVTKDDGGFDARAIVDLDAGSLAGTPTPSVALTAELTRAPSPSGQITATARAAVHEPGMPAIVSARLAPKRGALVVSFQADANAPELARIRRLRGGLSGRASAHVEGTFDLRTGTVDAQLEVAGERLEAAGARAASAHVEVRATGRPAHPSFDVKVAGGDVEVGRLQCGTLEAGARVGIAGGVTLEDVSAVLRGSDEHARLTAPLVRIASDTVEIDDAVIKGLGAPIEATVRAAPGSLYVKVRTGELDLERIARFSRVSIVDGGRASLDVDALVKGSFAEGRVAIDVKHGAFAGLRDAGARVELTLHGHQAAGVITGTLGDVGTLDVRSTSVQVGEAGPLFLSSWRRAWGAVDVTTHVDVPKLMAELPPSTLPFRRASGVIDAHFRIARDSMNDTTPEVDGFVSTTGLVLAGGTGASAWSLEGVDPTVRLTVDGDTGATAVDLKVRDAVGPILDATANSTAVPYAALGGFGAASILEALRNMPFDAHLDVPQRALESLPAALGLGTTNGELRASLDWRGAVSNPTLRATGTLQRDQTDPAMATLPADLSASVTYDGAHGDAVLQATNKNKTMLDASATFDALASDVLAGLGGADVPWTASGRAKLDALPLRSFAFLSDRQVRGKASGDLTIDRLHDDARARGTIVLDGLAVGDVACRSARVEASLDGHAFDGTARVEQGDAENGAVEAHAHAGAHWGRALVPALDTSQAAEFSVAAKQLRAALLFPFVSADFTSLDGRVDADAHVTIDPGAAVARPRGSIKLSGGSFELTTLGGEFGDVSAQVDLTPDGLVTVRNAVAHGVSGQLEAAATARMNGFAFAGARGTVLIPKNQPIPVVFDGVQMGMLDGQFELGADWAPAHDALDVTVGVPTLHMELPTSGTHDVQALGDIENVATGVMRSGSGFVDVPLDATVSSSNGASPRLPVKIAIKLGEDVTVSRDPDLDVRLQGQPLVTLADDVRVSGQIRILRGTIDVNGKPFLIENGTVTFSGDDPANPQVVLTAEWTAPDQTRVYADFTGPLKSGKVTLRSDPLLPGGQADIRALLLFGTTQTDTTGFQQVNPVAGAAGGLATQPINRALSGVNRALDKFGLAGGISTKIDTSQANPRPEVELQIARDVSLQVAYVLGIPAPGANPDLYYATLNWRFLRAWSLEATRGDQGTSILDFIWQHRY